MDSLMEIDDEDLPNYTFLGKAVGVSMEQCISLGIAHCNNFWDRVAGYRIDKDDRTSAVFNKVYREMKVERPEYFAVLFYEPRV